MRSIGYYFTFSCFVGIFVVSLTFISAAEDPLVENYFALIQPFFDEQPEKAASPEGEALFKAQIAIVFGPLFYAKCYGTIPRYADQVFNVVLCGNKMGRMIIPSPENPYDLDMPTTFAADFNRPKPGQIVSGYYDHPNGARMLWIVMLSDEIDPADMEFLESLRLQEGGIAAYVVPEPGNGVFPGGDPGNMPGGNPESVRYFFVHYMFEGDKLPNQEH